MSVLTPQLDGLRRMQTCEVVGKVAAVRGLSLLVDDLLLPIGSVVRLQPSGARQAPNPDATRGEVVGFDGTRAIVMLLNASAGITPGMMVVGEQDGTDHRGWSLDARTSCGWSRPAH